MPGFQQTIQYTTAQSNVTLSIRGAVTNAGTTAYLGSTSSFPLTISIYQNLTQSQLTYQASSGGLNPGEESITAASTCPIGTIKEDGTSYATSTYPALFAAIGYTYGGSGANFNVPNAQGVFERGAGSQTIGSVTYTGTQGTTQGDQMQGHFHSATSGQFLETTNSLTTPGAGSAQYNISGSSATTAGPTTDGTNGTPRVGAETRPANISHLHCIRTVPASPSPVIVQQVSSNTAGQERIERASLTVTANTGTNWSVVSQSGSWVSSVSTGTKGITTLTIPSGEFSAAPGCTCSSTASGSGGTIICNVASASATSVTVHTTDDIANDYSFPLSIICMGPR